MQITLKPKGKTLVAVFAGELDHHSAGELRSQVDAYLLRHNVEIMIFDFTKVPFMDSSGIGAILGRFKNIKQNGGKMAIVSVSSQVDKLLSLSGIKKLVPIYENTKVALEKLGGENK